MPSLFCLLKGRSLAFRFDGGISLHARSVTFIHPVSKEEISIVAPVPDDNLWKAFEAELA